jgi:adenylate cyclase
MAEERAQRRLVAILAADVVGFAGMTERDETGTFELLRAHRKEIFEPVIAQHGGHIFKHTGDGLLAEFGSVVDAVECAVALQQCVGERNGHATDDSRIEIRIGVNLGDVLVEGDDLHGDGVIIAARLEALAEPGGICLSAKVHEEVNAKTRFGFEDLGERDLKNISRPVRVFRICGQGRRLTPPAPRQLSSVKSSIAVLPFDNLSDDPSQQYFSDGITEDIITELSRFHGLFVRARNTSFQFRDKSVDVKQVGRELGVQYVVEGSVRRLGDRIRITAQLIDATSGNHLWAEHYDRGQQDIFAVQDHVVRSIVGTLAGRLEAARTEQSMRKPPTSLMAYDYVLRGNALTIGDMEAETEARRMYEKAIALDPTYVAAYGSLAYALTQEWFRDMTGSSVVLDRALDAAKKAVQLDETNSHCSNILGWVYLVRRAFDLAEHYYRRALELNPNSPVNLISFAEWLVFVGRADEAGEWIKQAKLVDPYYNPQWWWRAVGVFHFNRRQYDDAIAAFSRSPILPNWVHAYIAASHALAGRIESGRESCAEVLRLSPDYSISYMVAKEPYRRPVDREHLIKGLREAGLPE